MSEHSHADDSSQISDEITHALHHSWFFDPLAITVSEEDGVVTLSGSVATSHDRRRAAIAAWSHPGVRDVVNDLRVA